MDIKAESKLFADSVTGLEQAKGKAVETLITIIENNTLGKEVIEQFIEEFAKKVTKTVKPNTLKVYKSQIRKIMTNAVNHKEEVIAKGKTAGNLDQWYKSFFDAPTKPSGTPTKTTKSDGKTDDKLGADDKKPSDQRDYVKEFHDSAKVMLESGMTAKQLHAVIDELAKQMTAKAA